MVFAQAELLKLQKSGQFPEEPVRIKVGQVSQGGGLKKRKREQKFVVQTNLEE